MWKWIGLYVFKSSTSGPTGDWTRDLPHHKRELIPVCHTTPCSATEATSSWSTFQGTLELLDARYSWYPQSTLNGTQTVSSLSSTASYETYAAGRSNLDEYVSWTCCRILHDFEIILVKDRHPHTRVASIHPIKPPTIMLTHFNFTTWPFKWKTLIAL